MAIDRMQSESYRSHCPAVSAPFRIRGSVIVQRPSSNWTFSAASVTPLWLNTKTEAGSSCFRIIRANVFRSARLANLDSDRNLILYHGHRHLTAFRARCNAKIALALRLGKPYLLGKTGNPMGRHSAIEWTDHTFNPWWGCVKVSPACAHCYAEAWSKRVGLDLWSEISPRRFFSEIHWNEPLTWDRAAARERVRRRVFCASMADVFEIRDDLISWRKKLWDLIERTPNLDWLLLTKRPENAQSAVPWGKRWPSNVWLGTTVENQEWARRRIPYLAKTPAAVRFLSCEPLLGPLDLSPWVSSIHWVIVGGESGHHARPLDPMWVLAMRDQATSAGIAFHFKQWGEWKSLDGIMRRMGKKAAGRILEGRFWDQLPAEHRVQRP